MSTVRFQAVLSEEDAAWVDQYAEKVATNRSSVIRLAVKTLRANDQAQESVAGRPAPESPSPAPKRPPAKPAATKSPSSGSYPRDPSDCPHKHRDSTRKCFACGDQR